MDGKRLDAYAQANGIEVPEELAAQMAEEMSADVLYNRRYEHMIAGRFITPDELDRLTEEVRGEAYRQARSQLVLEEVVRRQGFAVTDDELEDEARMLAERQQTTVETVKGFLGEDLAPLKDDILMRKAMDFVSAS